jgi:hypothetical protein
MEPTQPGGSGNISGIIYQMLWCLLRALKIRVNSSIDSDGETEALFWCLSPRVAAVIYELCRMAPTSSS